MASFGGEYGRSLQATSTWSVAVVCFVLVAVSLVFEQILHHIGSWFMKKRKPTLFEALEKIKAELMIMGFISLLLTILQEPLSTICIPEPVGHSWLPCSDYESSSDRYRDRCESMDDMVQFISAYGIHQLHVFIFVLAITHILFAIVTLGLGRLKMRTWRFWEDEIRTIEYQFYNDPERFRFARDTSFGRRHLHFWNKSFILLWTVSFFRQFFHSVQKVDYMTLRHGFITAHLAPHNQESFNFQKYITRSLDEDFKVVVGISPIIWLISMSYFLSNTDGWYSEFWLPFIPLIIILFVGAKLQVIITKMGMRILDRGDIVQGTIVVEPNDDLFWFKRPRFLLFLVHLVLFTNAFELAFLAWSWYEFGYPSCYHRNLEDLLIRAIMGIIVQVLCSYVTLPLYALVTQMGTSMKPVIFGNDVALALRDWHKTAKKSVKQGQKSGRNSPLSSRPGTPSRGSLSPVNRLRGYQNGAEGSSQVFPRRSTEGWAKEGLPVSPDHTEIDIGNHEIEVIHSRNSSLVNRSEIDRDVENPRHIQYDGLTSQRDFSFGTEQNSR